MPIVRVGGIILVRCSWRDLAVSFSSILPGPYGKSGTVVENGQRQPSIKGRTDPIFAKLLSKMSEENPTKESV